MSFPLILVFVILCEINNLVAGADQCFQCSTLTSTGCDDPFNTKDYQQCTNSLNKFFNCIKYKHSVGGVVYTVRGCRSEDSTCDDVRSEYKNLVSCSLCSSDFCNSSNRNVLLSTALIIPLIVIVFL